jgi:Uma2 family endonuclease
MSYPLRAPGPFQVDQIRDGDPYELSNGHPIQCLPTGGNGAGSNLRGGYVLDTDPAAPPVGIDAGIALSDGTLRAPDVAVGIGPEKPGWSTTVPPLVVEYAAEGQDLQDLDKKIDEFLSAGTRFVWVVRLVGKRRVEVHEPGKATRTVYAGGQLEAPGVLKNAVPVDALFDRDAAQEAALRNLVQRRGYDSFEDAVQKSVERGIQQGIAQGIQQGIAQGIEQGLRTGLQPLQHLFARRLGRPLTEGETATLLARFDTVGPDRLGDVVLDLTPDALAHWLTDPDAR